MSSNLCSANLLISKSNSRCVEQSEFHETMKAGDKKRERVMSRDIGTYDELVIMSI